MHWFLRTHWMLRTHWTHWTHWMLRMHRTWVVDLPWQSPSAHQTHYYTWCPGVGQQPPELRTPEDNQL